MPFIASSSYPLHAFLGNGHLQTIIPALFRKVRGVTFERQRIDIFDGDFLDLDWALASNGSAQKRLVIVTHGLEGSADRGYSLGMAKIFSQNNYDVLAWNHRGCSGVPNRLLRFYHSGASEDLGAIVDYALSLKKYDSIYLIGFSLGGNMTLKYLGEKAENIAPQIKKAVVFSVPLHLSSCSEQLRKRANWLYAINFKRKLRKKIYLKSKLMPEKLNLKYFKNIYTLKDFDDYYTAPLHGFINAEDYYEKSSSLYHLSQIHIKTLIVNALNDSFLGEQCFPTELAKKLELLYLETPIQGGHCGFPSADENGFYWSERRALQFIEDNF